MKFEERINIPVTQAFKDRLDRAIKKEAQTMPGEPSQASVVRDLIRDYCDRILNQPKGDNHGQPENHRA